MSLSSLDSNPFAVDCSKNELLTDSIDWIGSLTSLSSIGSGAASVVSEVEASA